MKKITLLCLLMVISLVVFSCSSEKKAVQQDNPLQLDDTLPALDPEEIVGKQMVGYHLARGPGIKFDVSTIFKLKLDKDGTFELQRNDTVFYGKWIFDKDIRPFRYLFSWFMGEKIVGYNMNFHKSDNRIFWWGEEFYSNGKSVIVIQFRFEE